jgi:tight adherence protein B
MIVAALLAAASAWLMFPAGRRLSAPERSLEDVVRWVRSHRPGGGERVAQQHHAWVTRFAGDLAAEIRSGRQPLSAWSRLWMRGPFYDSAPTQELEDLALSVMRQEADRPGCSGLLRVAACWEVAAVSGAGLADSLDRVAAALAAESEVADEIDGQLAGARATTRLLLVLPLFGLALGRSLGADTTGVLLHTTYGWACLAVGGALLVLGWRWSRAQVRGVASWLPR